jgi:hypothetical protein
VNLKTGGTSLVVGAVGGVLENTQAPLAVAGLTLDWALVAGAVALVGGVVLQSTAPFTQPDIADGLIDSGLALVGLKGSQMLLKATGTASGWSAHQVGPAFAGLYGSMASPCARGSLGGIQGVPKRELV